MSADPQETSTTSPSGRRLALIVGVNGQAVSGRAPLQYAVDDGRDMAQILQQACCRFELFRDPLLDEQATTSQVRDAVLDLANELQEDDFALFFFSGHAEAMVVDADLDDVYLVTYDFNTSRAKRDKNAYLSLRWLRRILFEHEQAGSILLVFDCCYAGKFSESASDHYLDELQQRLRYYFAEPGAQSASWPEGIRLALTATGTSIAKEQDGHGVMTGHILNVLRGECEQAANKQGYITFTGLFGYLKTVMPNQQPRFFGAGDDLVLALHPHLAEQERNKREQEARRDQREHWLRSLFADQRGFLQDRLESFVGRAQELEEVSQHIDKLLPTGGYLTITGQAGQGKSSIIAKLIEFAAREQGGYDCIAFHSGQSHLNFEGVVKYGLKSRRREDGRRSLRRPGNTLSPGGRSASGTNQTASIAGYYHYCDLWSDLWSAGMGRN
jgi:Caspase domain